MAKFYAVVYVDGRYTKRYGVHADRVAAEAERARRDATYTRARGRWVVRETEGK